MKLYTAINENNIHYSFKAEDDQLAKEFCEHKFSTPFEKMIVVENTNVEEPCQCGRIAWANGKHID